VAHMGIGHKALAVVALAVGGLPGAWACSTAVVDMPVAFRVHHTNNDSKVPCAADNGMYTVRGHLVAPRTLLDEDEAAAGRSITFYLHGGTAGEWMWHLAVPGFSQYDMATSMARDGHASLVIDRLGYDRTDHPDGTMVCIGSEAEVAHQIVSQLRDGAYSATDGDGTTIPGPAFARVTIAGQSQGAIVAQAEAYSFGDVDGLILMGWSEPPTVPLELVPVVAQTTPVTCARGGDHAEFDGTGPAGYVYEFGTYETEESMVFYDADPALLTELRPLLNRDPCGVAESIPAEAASAEVFLGTITAPVLFINGDHDLTRPEAVRLEAARMTGSSDVSVATIPHAGHTSMLERQAPAFRSTLAAWLAARGF